MRESRSIEHNDPPSLNLSIIHVVIMQKELDRACHPREQVSRKLSQRNQLKINDYLLIKIFKSNRNDIICLNMD